MDLWLYVVSWFDTRWQTIRSPPFCLFSLDVFCSSATFWSQTLFDNIRVHILCKLISLLASHWCFLYVIVWFEWSKCILWRFLIFSDLGVYWQIGLDTVSTFKFQWIHLRSEWSRWKIWVLYSIVDWLRFRRIWTNLADALLEVSSEIGSSLRNLKYILQSV